MHKMLRVGKVPPAKNFSALFSQDVSGLKFNKQTPTALFVVPVPCGQYLMLWLLVLVTNVLLGMISFATKSSFAEHTFERPNVCANFYKT